MKRKGRRPRSPPRNRRRRQHLLRGAAGTERHPVPRQALSERGSIGGGDATMPPPMEPTVSAKRAEEDRAAKVEDLFSRIAPRYDLINDLQSFGLHRFWKKRVLNLVSVQPDDRVLDVCCGTGDIALALAGTGANVIGLDFSQPMLEMAKLRKLKVQSHNLEFVRGDAQQIPFPDNSFNVVTVGYGLRNLADWEAGLRELCRVAKPGGRLVVLDFGKPDNALW